MFISLLQRTLETLEKSKVASIWRSRAWATTSEHEQRVSNLSQCVRGTSNSEGIARAGRDGTRAETRFRLSPKRTSPFKSVGASVQSTAGSRGVRISFSNAGYTTFGGGVRVLATHSIRLFPLHFPSRASPCATRFRTSSTTRNGIAGVSRRQRLLHS